MMIQTPRRWRGGLGDVMGPYGPIGYPTTGRHVSLADLNAGYQAVSQFAPVAGSANSPAGWPYATSMNTDLSAQRGYIRSLYDAATARGGVPDGSGNYYEPAYPAYDYSGSVPSWAQPFLPGLVAEPAVGETPRTPDDITAQIEAVTSAGVPAGVTIPTVMPGPAQVAYPIAPVSQTLPAGVPPLSQAVSVMGGQTAAQAAAIQAYNAQNLASITGGAQSLPAGTPPLSDAAGADVSLSSLSSVPTWAWLAGAGVALFFLMRGK